MKKIAVFVFLFLSFTPTFAQEKGLLFKISGNGLQKPSYVFGTIHVLCEKDFELSDSVLNAISVSQQITLEIDTDAPGMLFKAMKDMKMKGDSSLKDLYNPEDYAYIKSYFKDTLQLPFGMLANTKPMLLSTFLVPKLLNCPMVMFEKEFEKIAKKQKKEILGLETLETQLAVFDTIPYQKQAKSLLDELHDSYKTKAEFEKMVTLYKNKDIEGLLSEFTTEQDVYAQYEDILLNDRNKSWIPVIRQMANEKPTFFAVGAGHLSGEKGVLNLLQKAGFTVQVVN